MSEEGSSRRHPWWLADLLLAAGFLTRLPFPSVNPGERTLMRTAWCFPIIGAGVGGVTALILLTAQSLGLPNPAAALVAVAATALLTGALHEDGLADLADGFGGGHDAESKIAIMRDSRIGTYGVLTLILATGLKASALATLIAAGDPALTAAALIAVHAAARAMMVPVAFWLPPASDRGVGRFAGEPRLSTVPIALGIAAAILLLLLPFGAAIVSAAIAGLAATAIAGLARRQIGGYTGDVLGATEQTVETCLLLTLAAALP